MSHSRLEMGNVVFDARRAVWFSNERVLAVADLHLGYAWAHRLKGQLMPITPSNDTLARLQQLQHDYEPREIIVLGDVVHRALALEVLEKEMRELFNVLSCGSQLVFLAGNHDRNLQKVFDQWSLPIEFAPSRSVGDHLLVHGDAAISPADAKGTSKVAAQIVMGHEHPAITLGDGVTTSEKCPCFLVSNNVLVLPAFSRWAAGTNIRVHPFMSTIAREAEFESAVAIVGNKLLRVRL